MRLWLSVCLMCVQMVWAQGVRAQDAVVPVCFNYGCASQQDVQVGLAELERVRARLLLAGDAEAEREALADIVGQLYGLAGRQTPVNADRAGNYLDFAVEGRMDCIDHSTTTTRWLQLLVQHGMLRFHRVLEPARRTRWVLQHFGAVIEEIEPPPGLRPEPTVPDHVPLMLALCDCAEVLDDIPALPPLASSRPGERYVVDSWFVDNGEAAIVLPLANWLDGEGPNVQ